MITITCPKCSDSIILPAIEPPSVRLEMRCDSCRTEYIAIDEELR